MELSKENKKKTNGSKFDVKKADAELGGRGEKRPKGALPEKKKRKDVRDVIEDGKRSQRTVARAVADSRKT